MSFIGWALSGVCVCVCLQTAVWHSDQRQLRADQDVLWTGREARPSHGVCGAEGAGFQHQRSGSGDEAGPHYQRVQQPLVGMEGQ